MTSRIIKPPFEYTDERGTLIEIISGHWESVNYHDRKKGFTAGGHYHKETDEYFYVISGKVEVAIQKIGDTEKESFLVSPKEGFLIPRQYYHSLRFIEDSQLIALLSKKNDSNNPDIYK